MIIMGGARVKSKKEEPTFPQALPLSVGLLLDFVRFPRHESDALVRFLVGMPVLNKPTD